MFGVISWARWFSIGDRELVASVGPSRFGGVPLGRRGCWVATAVGHLQCGCAVCSVARRTRGAMGSGACSIGKHNIAESAVPISGGRLGFRALFFNRTP